MAFNTNQRNPAPNTNSALMEIPVPSPQSPFSAGNLLPPKPFLQASLDSSGGVNLTWDMDLLDHHAAIGSYRIFCCKQSDISNRCGLLWKKLGDIPALRLPMTCTLAQFVHNERYYFIICGVDEHNRLGHPSDPVSLVYKKEGLVQRK